MLEQSHVLSRAEESGEGRLDELEGVGFESDDAEFVCQDEDVDVVEDVIVRVVEVALVESLVKVVEGGCYGLRIILLHVDDAGAALLSWC